MTSDIVIRLGTQEDITQISKLWLQMVNELRPGLKPNVSWWQTMCRNFMDATNLYTVIVALDKSTIIGFVDGFIFPEPATGKAHGVAQHFFILPEYRKTNIAQRLYLQILKLAKQKKASCVEFFCFSDNKEFWLKKNYKEMRIMMRKELHYV